MRRERNYDNPYLKHVLIRLEDLRCDGRFGYEKVYVNLLRIPILNGQEQPMGVGLVFTDYIKVDHNTMKHFFKEL